MTRVYWLQVWLTPREQGEIMIVSQKRAKWFKISLVERWQPPGKSIHHRQRHSPTHPTVGAIVEVGAGMCMWMRPSSRSWLWGFILKGLLWDLLFLLLKDDLSLSRVGRVPLCAVHSAFSGSAWYAVFTLIWWIQGTIPATLTEVGVVRITV